MTDIDTPPLALAAALGLKPLDRLQVASRWAVKESRTLLPHERDHPYDLPFWYFQYVTDDGLLCLSSPSGYVDYVSPHDVCDILPSEPVHVRAMPKHKYLERLRLSQQEMQQRPPDDFYAWATVIAAQKDRWGRFEYHVLFDDRSLHQGGGPRSQLHALHDDDKRALDLRTRRTLMPVIQSRRSNAGWSADAGVERAAMKAQDKARTFLKAALARDQATVSELTSCDATTGRHKKSPRAP